MKYLVSFILMLFVLSCSSFAQEKIEGEKGTKRRATGIGGDGSEGSKYKVGVNKNRKLTGDVDDSEGSGRSERTAGTAGRSGGGISSGGSSVEGTAVEQTGDNSSGLLRSKKKGTATSVGVSSDQGAGYNAGANKGKKLTGDVDDSEGAGKGNKNKPVDD